ncbi:hypothetical protein ABZ847_22490 [Streptomyces bauhiniae]
MVTAAVRGVVAHFVGTMAKRVGPDDDEAAHLVTPKAVANVTVKATAERKPAAVLPHAVRPVRRGRPASECPC